MFDPMDDLGAVVDHSRQKVPQTQEQIDVWLGRYVRVSYRQGDVIEGLGGGYDGYRTMCLMFPLVRPTGTGKNTRLGNTAKRLSVYLSKRGHDRVTRVQSALACRFRTEKPTPQQIASVGLNLVRRFPTYWMQWRDFLKDVTATFGKGRRGLRKQVEEELRSMRMIR